MSHGRLILPEMSSFPMADFPTSMMHWLLITAMSDRFSAVRLHTKFKMDYTAIQMDRLTRLDLPKSGIVE
jgi:hypothetical protein